MQWQKVLYIMLSAQLLSAVGFSMIFPFLPGYVEHLGSSFGLELTFLAAAVFSAQALTMALASPIWGALADRLGRKLMVERAMFGGSLIILLMGFASSAEMLVLLRAIQGLITGTVAASNALVAAVSPRERTGYAMGVMQVGTWSGVALGPLIGGVLADAFGYHVAFYFTAALLFAGGLVVHFGVTEPQRAPARRTTVVGDMRQLVAAPGVGAIYAFRFIAWLGRSLLVPYLPLFIATLLASQQQVNSITGLTIGLTAAAGTASAVLLGRLGDRLGHRRVLVSCALVTAAGYLPQLWVSEVWQLLLLQLVTGAAAGGIMPVLSALLNHYTAPGQEGAAFGMDNSVASLSKAVAPMLGAALVGLGGFRLLFAAAALLFALIALAAQWQLPSPRPQVVRPALGD
jgi:DHA1 family multidrug resistance protein-like MFS transporter